MKKNGNLQDLLNESESLGEFERAAALAVWHGDLKACVSILQRGAEDVRALLPAEETELTRGSMNLENYSELLSLISMCVAGFNITTADDGTRLDNLWSGACNNLLRRLNTVAEMTGMILKHHQSHVLQLSRSGLSYLRAILVFLQSIGAEDGGGCFHKTIYDENLSLADRVGFACHFLPRTELYEFLKASVRKCESNGLLEGLLITGLDKRGIGLLQSYVDQNSDVQTAAMISW